MQGVIKFINKKEWKGREGLIILNSFKLEGDGELYKTGTDPVPYIEGDAVSFDVDAKGNVNLKSMRKLEKEEVSTSPEIQKAKASAGARDHSIHYQSARKTATDFVLALVAAGMLPVGTKKADQADKVFDYINEYTVEFLKVAEEFLSE